MPTYQYKCPDCGEVQEHFHGVQEIPVFTCSSCGTPLKRMISGGTGIHFRGSGFYLTDYSGKHSSPSGKSGKS